MYYTLSELLIDARNEKGLSLSEVEKETRIRAEYIDALENSRYQDLPADVYVRGILKNYAAFLNLDFDEVVRLYRKDGVISGVSQEDMRQTPPYERKSKVVFLGKLSIGALTFFACAVIGWYLFSQYRVLNAAPILLLENPVEETLLVSNPDIVLSGRTELSAKLFLNDQEVSISGDGSFKIPFQLQSGENSIEFRVQSLKNEKQTSVKRNIMYTPLQATELSLEIEAKDISIEVDVEWKGNVLFSGVILPGELKKINGGKGMVIQTDNAKNTFWKLDGVDKGAVGEQEGEGFITVEGGEEG